MTLDPEGNLWFSNVTRYDASEDFAYACAATSVFRLVILYVEKRASLYSLIHILLAYFGVKGHLL